MSSALVLLCVVFALRGLKRNLANVQASSSNLKLLNLTLVANLSEEEKNALKKQSEEEQGLVLHFLSSETEEKSMEEKIKALHTDILLGGDAKTGKLLSEYSSKAKTPYLATTFLSREFMGDYSFCMGRSIEDQAVDISFFAFNEAFRSMGILEKEGNPSSLSPELSEAFQILGGTSRILQYTSAEDLKEKINELENSGADILFLEGYSEEGRALLEEEHKIPILLGEDWDRNDFPGTSELKTSCYLYGKNTVPATEYSGEQNNVENESDEQSESIATEAVISSDAEPTTNSNLDDPVLQELFRSREMDAVKSVQLALERQGKSLFEQIEGLNFRGTSGEYQLMQGGYALLGRPIFYEILENKRVELSR